MKTYDHGQPECAQRDSSRRLILVVDDEKRIADTLVLILASKGYLSKAAYDGATALGMCRECTLGRFRHQRPRPMRRQQRNRQRLARWIRRSTENS